jgi:hypothetical protein
MVNRGILFEKNHATTKRKRKLAICDLERSGAVGLIHQSCAFSLAHAYWWA